ncbi:hypothetical protein Syun_027907 [Stephania yunnanensis]|uniref:Uncharacterized protein n=1 Tax=Stephania yunnanensis TaxID=152371 RepID=A0AAP0EGF5_9MAGN
MEIQFLHTQEPKGFYEKRVKETAQLNLERKICGIEYLLVRNKFGGTLGFVDQVGWISLLKTAVRTSLTNSSTRLHACLSTAQPLHHIFQQYNTSLLALFANENAPHQPGFCLGLCASRDYRQCEIRAKLVQDLISSFMLIDGIITDLLFARPARRRLCTRRHKKDGLRKGLFFESENKRRLNHLPNMYLDKEKAKDSLSIRPVKGKMKNIRYHKGPQIMYRTEEYRIVKDFRNIPGVEVANVELEDRLSHMSDRLWRFGINEQKR